MRVRVRLVSLLRDVAGSDTVVVEVPSGARLSDVVGELYRRFPKLREVIEELERRGLNVVYMVNGRFSGFDEEVDEDAEVVILPPASGG